MRRKWIAILRIARYGASNFFRNLWLSTAATAVMVITLTIVLATFAVHLVSDDTLRNFRQKIDISVYLCDKQVPGCKQDVSEAQRQELAAAIQQVPVVTGVDFVTKEDARQKFIDDAGGDPQKLAALETLGERNPFPSGLRIHVSDTNRLAEVGDLVKQPQYKDWQAREASIVSERGKAIQGLADAARFAEIGGLAVSALFLVISIMIIFNTIRMAIFNRRDEIEIMKLIGAEKSFIRGPFIVEACLYGVIAALVSFGIVAGTLVIAGPGIARSDVAIAPTQALFAQWPLVIVAAQVLIGVLIGVISSLLAMRRYLKV